PAATSTPPVIAAGISATSTCTTARPAVSISTRLGTRYCVRAAESHAAASLAERTGIGFTTSAPPRTLPRAHCHRKPNLSGGSLQPPPASPPELAPPPSPRPPAPR